MQFSRIALVAAAACVATVAAAAPNASRIAKSASSSSIQNNVRLAVESLCKAPNVATSFVNGNFTTVVCADVALGAAPSALYVSKPDADFKNFDGLPFAEIRFNVSNGAFGSVQILNGVPFNFRNPGTGLNTDPTTGGRIFGGISDIEIGRYPASTIGSNILYANNKAGVALTYGVAASAALYTKMFDAQKLAGLIPAVCTVGSTNLSYCIPNMAKAQMATIMSANDFNAAYLKGLEFLTNNVADRGVELRYVRRTDTSGIQAEAQNYFLGLPCSLSQLSVVAEPTTTDPAGSFNIRNVKIENIRVYAADGSGDVRFELNKTGVFALGILSGENNQTGQSWRWLRVDGAPIGENATPGTPGNTNVNTLKDGSYSFYSEATYTGGNVTNDNYWATIATAFFTLAAPVGLLNQSELDGGFNEGGSTCLSSSSN